MGSDKRCYFLTCVLDPHVKKKGTGFTIPVVLEGTVCALVTSVNMALDFVLITHHWHGAQEAAHLKAYFFPRFY